MYLLLPLLLLSSVGLWSLFLPHVTSLKKGISTISVSLILCVVWFFYVCLNYVLSKQIIASLCNCNHPVFLSMLYDLQSLCNDRNSCSPLPYSVACGALCIPLTHFRSNGLWKSTVLWSDMSFLLHWKCIWIYRHTVTSSAIPTMDLLIPFVYPSV